MTAKRIAGSATKVALHGMVVVALVALAVLGLLPRTGVYRTVSVLTGSMRPRIDPGAMVVVVRESPADLRVGQIITYQSPLPDHRVVTHRVVAIEHPGMHPIVQTKGDANNAPDPWKARIEGRDVWRVRAVVPYGGRVIAALRGPVVRRLSLWLVPLLLAIAWMREIWRTPASARAEPAPVRAEPQGGVG
jgi:signal peptidase